ncbi:hypothetical protein EPO34_01855 [Patescibacteria group bacterium]|nr:MAG: hypothetical protein EPO34_01855 [Patescibacteria group bacterium]
MTDTSKLETSKPASDLIHGLFTPLARKLEMVRNYPGVTQEMIAEALDEANVSGLLGRYEAESPEYPRLDVVVTVYRESVLATFLYARDRMREAFGEGFSQWEHAYGEGVDENRIRLLEGVPDHRNCVRIEVLDLRDCCEPQKRTLPERDGYMPSAFRVPRSATFAPIYAGAQSPRWVRQMSTADDDVPWVICGGIELNDPCLDKLWGALPGVRLFEGKAELFAMKCDCWVYPNCAMPSLWTRETVGTHHRYQFIYGKG